MGESRMSRWVKLSAHLGPFHINMTWCLSIPTKMLKLVTFCVERRWENVFQVNVNDIIPDLHWDWTSVPSTPVVYSGYHSHKCTKTMENLQPPGRMGGLQPMLKPELLAATLQTPQNEFPRFFLAVGWSDETEQRAESAGCSELSVVLKSRQ